MQNGQDVLSRRGLTLSRQALKRLAGAGIVVQSGVSLEYQQRARRYVVRGVESGGAVTDLGRYVTYCGSDGAAIPCLYPIDAIAVNGVHAVAVSPVLVRVELFRAGRTCQLLVTRHQPGKSENRRRPPIESVLLFRGVNGLVDQKPSANRSVLGEPLVPFFWSRSGEEIAVPPVFAEAIAAATRGSNCLGCSHPHFLTVPVAMAVGVDNV